VIAATAGSWAFAGLLALAGASKIGNPAATGAALQGARLPSNAALVRLLGAGEIVLAIAVLGVGGTVPLAGLALAYAAFAVFAQRQSSRGAGCGCFGEQDAPATGLHVAIDAAGALVAATAAIWPAPSLLAVAGADLLPAVLAVGLLITAVAALRLALVALPELAVATALVAPEENA
jgi:hypothetical protein